MNKCGLCGSEGVNASTCPLNPIAANNNPQKHLLATIHPEIFSMMLLNTDSEDDFNNLSQFCTSNSLLRSICNESDVINHYYTLISNSGFNWIKFNSLFEEMINIKNPQQSKTILMNLNTIVYTFISSKYKITMDQFMDELQKWIKTIYFRWGKSKKLSNQLSFIFRMNIPSFWNKGASKNQNYLKIKSLIGI